MAQYQKRTNNFFRRVVVKREVQKQRGKFHKKSPELKSITIIFQTSRDRDLLYRFFMQTLEREDFKVHDWGVNHVVLMTTAKKKYNFTDSRVLLDKMLRELEKQTDVMIDAYFSKYLMLATRLYKKRGKIHIDIRVGFSDEEYSYVFLAEDVYFFYGDYEEVED